MTREQTIAANDELRTQLKGGLLLFSPAVAEFPPWFRGRIVYRLTQTKKCLDDMHSEGVFVFGGYVFYWVIGEFAGERSISILLAEDMI